MKQNCTMQHFDISYDNCFDEAIDLAVGIVKKSADILFVNLSSCWLSLENINQSLSQLQCISSLCHIDLSSSCIDEQLVDQICALLYNSVNLEHLNLSNCKVKASGLLKIAQKLKCNTLLHHLDISSNDVSFQVMLDVLNVISSNSAITLSHLNISNCRLHQKEDNEFTENEQITTLSYLNFSYNVISSQAAFAIARLFAKSINIRHLNMSALTMQDDDLGNIIGALRGHNYCNSSLEHIDLSKNTLTKEASNDLAMVVNNNKNTLKHLDLKNCQILGGTIQIFKALTLVTSLEYLSLSKITITDQVESKLRGTIANNPNLRLLDLCHCALRSEFLSQKLSAVFNIRSSLEHLNINKNHISNSACLKLAKSLHTVKHLELSGCFRDPVKFSVNLLTFGNVTTLKYLNLSGNASGSCVEGLIQLIGNNSGLQHLDVSKCEIEKTGIKVLFDILGAQNSLCYIDFSDNNISMQHPNAAAPNIENSGLMHLVIYPTVIYVREKLM